MKKRLAMLALAGAMTMSMLSGCGSKIDDSAVVATVGDEEISVGLANFYARMTQAQYQAYYAGYMGDDMWSGEASEGKTYQESVKDSIMEDLENMVLSKMHMEEYDVTLTDEEENAIKKAAKEFDDANTGSDKEKVSGTQEIVEEFLTLTAIRQKVELAVKDSLDVQVTDEEAAQKSMQYVLFANTGVDEETGSATPLTDEELEQRKEDALKFAEEAKTAGELESLAEGYGVEVKTATFNVNNEASVPEEIVKAADALNEGEITEAVETENGYYIAKVTSLFDEEATKSEKESMIAEKEQEGYNKILEGWREETEISVKESVWKKVDFTDLTVSLKIDETDSYTDQLQTDDQAEAAEASE
ncbi:MAG: peptidyl-prolyl cis-trans isomerase [Eubacteriales bacterium]|nr:peptidyl-prolyl cis-trans isomerase [Eubacteriales bacterium]